MKIILINAVIFALVFSVPLQAKDLIKSTIEDQVEVEVTVYNSNIGLIKDTRSVKLPKGQEKDLQFMDVAAHIMPVTVHVKSLNAPEQFSILEQNYEYDLINSQKLLDKYVGKKIKLIEHNQYQDRKNIVDAILLSNNQGQIYKIENEIYLGYPGSPVLPEIPDNLIAKPTLMWRYVNDLASAHHLQVSYLTNNINWKADYVLLLDDKDISADLSGWVTIDNRSGTSYNNAKLKLVAGDVNRVLDKTVHRRRAEFVDDVTLLAAGAPQFEQQAFFEYHIYDLQRKTDIRNNQTKQISLLEANGIKVSKEFLFYGQSSFYMIQHSQQIPRQNVQVWIAFKNEKENNLGMPLPAGIIRLYKQDGQKSLQFIGEDRIAHTPRNEEVRIKVGEAFDVVAERKQVDYRQVTRRMHESQWEVKIRNQKDEDIVVGLIEPIQGSWTMISNSHPYKKEGAFSVRFDVPVQAGKESVVTYRVQTGF